MYGAELFPRRAGQPLDKFYMKGVAASNKKAKAFDVVNMAAYIQCYSMK
jgi:hypothetical protein